MQEMNTKLQDVERIIEEEIERSKVPGMAVGIVHDGRLVYEKCHGKAKIEENQPVTPKTNFMYGSITKFLTVIAVMQQWEQGKFKLDDSVNDYLPDGKILIRKGWPPVTFKHLLTHQGGIGELRRFRDIFHHGFRLLTYDDEPIPPMSSLHDLPIHATAPAGRKYAYSNIGVSVLGYIVEQLTGKSFRDYVLENILDPLGMDQTDLIRSERVRVEEAYGYKHKKGSYKRAKRWNNIIKPSGSLVSNLVDMTKFATMLMDRGNIRNTSEQLLSPETMELMWTPHYWSHEAIKDRKSIGLVFRLYHMNGKKVIDHTGSVNGFTAAFSVIPEDKIAIIVNGNLHEGLIKRSTKRIRNRLLKLFTGLRNDFNEEHKPDKKYWKEITGHYVGYPGWLSNTRLVAEGIEFEVYQDSGELAYRSLTRVMKRGIKLYPTEDPLVYVSLPKDEAESLFFTNRLAFKLGDDGKVKEMGKDFFKLRKVPYYKTIEFRILCLSCLITFIITFTILGKLFGVF
ncbi:serine hydrolase [Candidatus Bathyarchaeota archaeon]|nr:serine hydrolase [Candidatus Bathyarchaeota archaeon]